jgi:hypothetical protein
MDLGRLAAYGRPTTRTACATNPVRRVSSLSNFRGAEWGPTFARRSRVQRGQMASRGRRCPLTTYNRKATLAQARAALQRNPGALKCYNII